MRKIRVARKWWLAGLICGVSLVATVLPAWLVTRQAVQDARAGRPLSNGWNWWAIAAWDLALLGFSAFICWGALVQMLTVFTEEGAGRLSLRGRIFLRWPDIKQFEESELDFLLIAGHGAIRLSRVLLRDPDRLRDEIIQRLPVSALEPQAAELAAFRTAYARYVTELAESDVHLTMVPQATLDVLAQIMSAEDDLRILLDPASDTAAVARSLAAFAPVVGLSPASSPGLVLADMTELVIGATPDLPERY